MKKTRINFSVIFISIIALFLIGTGIASWIISISINFKPEKIESGDLISSLNTESVTYDGNGHLPTLVDNPLVDLTNSEVFANYKVYYRLKKLDDSDEEQNFVEVVFESSYVPDMYYAKVPINAGTYEIKYQKNGVDVYTTDFIIKQVELSNVTAPSLSTVIYGELPTITQPTGAVTTYTLYDGTVENISGTFNFYSDPEDIKFNTNVRNYSGTATTMETSTDLIFTPSSSNYKECKIDATYNVNAVAYLNASTPTYYCTIERALELNTTSGTIYVIPGINPNIYENIEICSNVVLNLPYEGTLIGDNFDSENITGNSQRNPTYARNYSSTFLKSNVTLMDSKIIEINGSLQIGGVKTGGGGTQAAGQTAGNYAQLTLGKNSQIICNGSITCYGYILETSFENNSLITMNKNATLTVPFIVEEHRGGTILVSMAHLSGLGLTPNLRTAPFNRFHFNNIDPIIRFEYQSILKGVADLYAQSTHNTTLINLIGPLNNDTAYLISMNSNTTVIVNYNHNTQIIDLDINGSFTLNPLSISISYLGISKELSTADVYLPISWYYNISINKFENGNSSTVNLAKQKIKCLPGSKLVINNGVTVNANEITIFSSVPEDKSSGGGVKYPTTYPTGNLAGTTIPGSSFIVNGTLVISKLGGIVLTESEGAKIKITNSNLVETEEFVDTGPKYETKREYFRGYLYTSSGVSNVLNVIGAGEYESKMDSKDKCGWLANEINLSYDLNLGEGIIEYKNGLSIRDDDGNVVGYTIEKSDYPSINNPQRDNYTFKGWSLDPNDDPDNITSSIGEVVYANTVFYAIWKPIEYTLTYDTNNYYNGIEYKEDDSLQISNETIQNDYPTTYNVEGRYPLPVPVLEGYKFGGWYTDYSEESGYTNKITEIDGALYSGNKTIYGVWNPDYVKEYSISFEIMYNDELLAKTVNSSLGFGDTTQNCFEETGVDFDLTNYINRLIAYNENSTIDLYYSVIYLVMPDETETKINIDNSVVKITDNNTLNNIITFRIYQYDKIKVVFDQYESLETNVIPNNTTVDTYSKYITFVVPNPSNVTQGYRMVWFTSEDKNNATFFIGGEEYSDGINSSISNFDDEDNQLMLYGEQYYLLTTNNINSSGVYVGDQHANILFYKFQFDQLITTASVSVKAGSYLGGNPSDTSSQISSFKGISIEKIIISECYASETFTTLGATGEDGVSWRKILSGTQYYSVRKYCGLFDSVTDLKQVIFGDEKAVSLVGKYAFSDVDTSSIDFIGINTTTITNGYDTQSTSSKTPPTDERTINIIKRL